MKDFNLKQSLRILAENPFFTMISILGTALAITMIMVIIILWQVQTADYEPETRRDRMLIIKNLASTNKVTRQGQSSGVASVAFMKEVVYPVETLEEISAASIGEFKLVSTPDRTRRIRAYALETDEAFWRIFDFRFLDGKPFELSMQTSQARPVVVCESLARRLFGRTDVAGQDIRVAGTNYRISGVVRDVSSLAVNAYAEMWYPYSPDLFHAPTSEYGWGGNARIFMLAASSADFPEVRRQIDQNLQRFNANLQEREYDLMGQPDDVFTNQNRIWTNIGPDMNRVYWQYAIALLVLLMVPAVNLSGLSASRMQKRLSELGTRRAFGAARPVLVRQILMENFVLTLIGSLLGLALAYLTVVVLKDWLFVTAHTFVSARDIFFTASMLIRPSTFLIAFVFCLLLNLLSAGIPAWNVTRRHIVEALNER